MYGCYNCRWHKIYKSNSYYEPDEHECEIPSYITPDFELDDEELDRAITRCWSFAEEWNNWEDQICPYYQEADYYDEYYD